MLRFGLVGCGTHARWAVMPALAAAEGCELVAVAEIVPECLETPETDGLARYADFREMLANEELDAVYVATPVDVHCEPTVAALEAGCHVVCEKPMAVDEAQCRRMQAAADAAGRVLAIDFELRQDAGHRRVRDWIAAGHLGAVRAVHIHSMWDGHKSFGDLAARRKAFLMRSGAMDCGVHMLDIVRFYCGGGSWRDVTARGAWFGEDVTYAPHISLTASLDTGVLVTIAESFAYGAYMTPRHQHHAMAIVGEQGVIARERTEEGEDVYRLTSESLCETFPLGGHGHGSAIALVLGDLCRAAAGEPVPPTLATGADGMEAQIALEAANRAALDAGDTAVTSDK